MPELSYIPSEQIMQPAPLTAGTGNTVGIYGCAFRVGGISVRLQADQCSDVMLDAALEPFRVSPGTADIHIQVTRVANLSPNPGCQIFDSGSVWRLYESEDGFRFDFTSPVVGFAPYKRLLVDDEFRRALVLLNDEYFRDQRTAPLEYPLDELLIMHRLTRENAIELHGCGISAFANGSGFLFVGHSGAGKSTTARLWSNHHSADILSDDRIILREHAGEMRMYGTPWHGEAMFASPNSAPLTRIFILEHGHGNVITGLSRSEAVAELFARSFVPFHRHEYVESALSFLERLADSVPCYRYSFEPDQRAVDKILQLSDL